MKLELRKDCDGCGETRIVITMSVDEAEMLRSDLPAEQVGEVATPMLDLFQQRLEGVLHEATDEPAQARRG